MTLRWPGQTRTDGYDRHRLRPGPGVCKRPGMKARKMLQVRSILLMHMKVSVVLLRRLLTAWWTRGQPKRGRATCSARGPCHGWSTSNKVCTPSAFCKHTRDSDLTRPAQSPKSSWGMATSGGTLFGRAFQTCTTGMIRRRRAKRRLRTHASTPCRDVSPSCISYARKCIRKKEAHRPPRWATSCTRCCGAVHLEQAPRDWLLRHTLKCTPHTVSHKEVRAALRTMRAIMIHANYSTLGHVPIKFDHRTSRTCALLV